MHTIHQRGRRSRASRAAVLAASTVLIVLSLPGPAAATSADSAAHSFNGWAAPTVAPPAINRPHAGTRVPVRFLLGGDAGMNILAPGWPRAQRVDCATREPIDGTLWRTHPYGSEGLEYDPDSGTYTYVWDVRPEWGNGALRCREFLLKLWGGDVHKLSFSFRAAPAEDPPADLACADVVGGEGSYTSEDTGGPLPDPVVNFYYELAAPSCAPQGGAVTKYRLLALAADSDGQPTSWLPIASQVIEGTGSSEFVIFQLTITVDPPPPQVCLYGYVKRGNRIVESVPSAPAECFAYALDAAPPGYSGWN